MIPRIVKAEYVKDYIIWLQFKDGTEGEVNLKAELWGQMFEDLKDVKQFQKMHLHPELHTIVWENGADFSPEFLYTQLKVTV
jgi:hypothetical protein